MDKLGHDLDNTGLDVPPAGSLLNTSEPRQRRQGQCEKKTLALWANSLTSTALVQSKTS